MIFIKKAVWSSLAVLLGLGFSVQATGDAPPSENAPETFVEPVIATVVVGTIESPIVTAAITPPAITAAKLIFVSDFETGAIQEESKNPDGWSMQNQKLPNATVVKCDTKLPVPKPRSGRCLVEFNLVRSEWPIGDVRPRAQLIKSKNGLGGFRQHKEYWIGMSTYHPTDWQWDYPKLDHPNNGTVFWQMHGHGGATGHSPPLVLGLGGQRLVIFNRSGNASVRAQYTNETLWTGALELGKWTDWIIRVKFSQTGTDGFVQIWRNGVKIAERMNKPTLYYTDVPRETDGAHQLLSLYKWNFAKQPTLVTKNTMYYDAYRIAEGANGKDLVDPAKN